MSNLWLLIRTEWKLMARGPMLWLLFLSAVGFAYLVYTIEQYDTIVLMFPLKYGFLYAGPLTIGAVLSGIYTAQRDRSMKAERIMEALPYRSMLLQPVRVLMTALPYMLLNLVPAEIMLAEWSKQLDGGSDIGGLLAIQLVFASGMLYPVILGWLVGTLLPGKLSYFLGFLVWLVHAYGGLMLLNVYLPESWYALPNFMLFDYGSMGYMDITWGYLTDWTFWLHRIHYFVLSVLLLLAGIWRNGRRRREPMPKLGMRIGTGSAALLVLLSAAGYIGIRSERIDGYRLWERQAQAQFEAVEENNKAGKSEADFGVASYKLNMEHSGDSHLAVQAHLELNGGDGGAVRELYFTLHPNFSLRSAKINGKETPFEKDGYRVTLRPQAPGISPDGAAVELAYEGQLAEWKLIHPYGGRPESKLERSYRADSTEWYLPGAAAWYPLPGLHALALPNPSPISRYSEWTEQYPQLAPARFEVSVRHGTGLRLYSNGNAKEGARNGDRQETLISETAAGLTLLAGPLQEIQAAGTDQVRLIAGKYLNPEHGRAYLGMLRKDFSEINRILNLRPKKLTLLPVEPSTDRGGQDLGGVVTLYGGTISYSEADSPRKARTLFVQQYLRYGAVIKADPYWLFMGMSGYLQSEGLAKPVQLDYFFDSSFMQADTVRLQDYMNSHSREEVEQTLRNMYEWLRNHEDGRLKLDDILK
jgi:hypothetical protein